MKSRRDDKRREGRIWYRKKENGYFFTRTHGVRLWAAF
jgi:hypothetical protein